MSNVFEKKLREHLHSEADETREFPRRLRGRIRDKKGKGKILIEYSNVDDYERVVGMLRGTRG